MKITTRYLPGLVLAGLLAGGMPALTAQEVAAPDGRPGVAGMLQEVTPSVVNISVTGSIQMQQNPLLNDPFFRRFFDMPEMQQQPQRRPTQSVGSGVIIDAEQGYVLTNHHVVENAEEIKITLQDRRIIDAELIGSDAGTDIALLQVEASNLKAIPRSDSDTLRVGDFVAAIGNPFGLGQTVTTGIVSAVDRSGIGGSDVYEDFIQTDASINPGNSGGALVDYDGRLVGINSAIIAPAGGNVGIGFAVPINMAMSIVDQLVEFGEVRRGMLGVQITDLTPDVVDALELDVADGAVVSAVTPGSPAEEAGIEAGDVIVAVNGSSIVGSSDLRNTIGLLREGSDVEIELIRDQRRVTVDAEIGSAPGSEVAAGRTPEASNSFSGAQLTDIPRDHPQYGDVDGAFVANVEQGSRAWNSGLRPGDIITAINRQPVSSADAVDELLASNAGTLALNVVRENANQFLIMR
jgi:serine protease DegQ